ncbi:MAG: MmgE/PrpD family protein, partial [Rhizobiales bacterium]|nr:MmgE/PrpD family protein [Hyphomicrobiales bacterium]
GWHATSTIGTLGAAAAACRLLSLSVDQVRMALGIATSHASGARQNFGTMMQAFHGGMPARNGVVAAELARRGFTADANMLEAPRGFFALFGPGPRKIEPETSALGKKWALERPVLALKLYPCGFPVFRPIEATMELATENDINPADVEEICCRTHYLIPETVFHENPQTGLEGKTSISYAVSRALIDRRMGLAQFTDEKVQDPQVRQLMKKVRVEVLPEYSKDGGGLEVNAIAAPAIVEITLSDGRTLSRRVEYYRGDPNRPLSPDDVAGKFRDCAGMVLASERTENVLDLMINLESLKDTNELVTLLTPQAKE